MENGNNPTGSTMVVDYRLFSIVGDRVQWDARTRVNCAILCISAGQKVGCRRSGVDECRCRVHSEMVDV